MRRRAAILLTVAVVAALAAATVAFHVNYLFKVSQVGRSYLEATQLERHRAVLENRAPAPWQYRPLSEWLVAAASRLLPVASAFVAVRLLWVWLAIALAWAYYRRLGLPPRAALLGLGLVCAAMTVAVHDSDLSLNTYGDLAFWLAGALLIGRGRDAALIALVPVAVLNRETALLLPIVALAVRLAESPAGGLRGASASRARLVPAAAALAAGTIVFVGVRQVLGTERALVEPAGHAAGIDLLLYNLARPHSYVFLLLTLGVAPLLALSARRSLPLAVRATALAMLPIWAIVHALYGVVAETRLFLVPIAIVLVPAALFAVIDESG